jgi:hypothetical protein
MKRSLKMQVKISLPAPQTAFIKLTPAPVAIFHWHKHTQDIFQQVFSSFYETFVSWEATHNIIA